MTATEIVRKMCDDFEMKTGKSPTEIMLDPKLFESLKFELKSMLPSGIVIDWIKFRGVMIRKRVLH